MTEAVTYLNGSWNAFSKNQIPINDLGFIHGITVAEQVRTFSGRPGFLEAHCNRFLTGLRRLDINLPERNDLSAIILDLADRNYPLIDPKLDLGICFFATPGTSSRFGPTNYQRPTFCVHSYLLPFAQLAEIYKDGQSLHISTHHEVPSTCWPRDIKVRSRLHYYLAEQEIRQRHPSSSAILTDPAGHFRETATATPIFVMGDGQLVVPPTSEILHSVSLDLTLNLAAENNLIVVRREIHLSELPTIRSMFLVSTPFCICDVSSLNDHPFLRESNELRLLRKAWSTSVDLDFVSQSLDATC